MTTNYLTVWCIIEPVGYTTGEDQGDWHMAFLCVLSAFRPLSIHFLSLVERDSKERDKDWLPEPVSTVCCTTFEEPKSYKTHVV